MFSSASVFSCELAALLPNNSVLSILRYFYWFQIVQFKSHRMRVAQNHKLQFVSEGFMNCTGVTSSVLKPSHRVRKNFCRGEIPLPRTDRHAIDVTCTAHNNETIIMLLLHFNHEIYASIDPERGEVHESRSTYNGSDV